MLEYWYIWYRVYEDGVLIDTGRYHRSYRVKHSADRRARQMWGTPQYNPLTNSTVKYMWIISQECPWKD